MLGTFVTFLIKIKSPANLFRGRKIYTLHKWFEGLRHMSQSIFQRVVIKIERREKILNQTNFSQHESLTDMTRFQITITTCLRHRWFCNCGIVLCLQLPGHIGAKYIYFRHSPRRRVTVLRSCYIRFQGGNCVHCTKTVRCSTGLVRELEEEVGKECWFLFSGVLLNLMGSQEGVKQKQKQKHLG